MKTIHKLGDQRGASPAGPPSAQHTPLFDQAGAAEWRTSADGDGQAIDYGQPVQVVVRPGNRWKTPDREYTTSDGAFAVTLAELAAHPSALQSQADHQAEQARNRMLAPQQAAARERVEQMRASVDQQLSATTTDQEADAAEARRRTWRRQQAASAHTKEQLDQLLADQAIDQETYRERLLQLIPEAEAAPAVRPAPLAGRDAPPPAPAPPSGAPMPLEQRLAKLKALLDQGLISQPVWERRQAEILAEV